MSRAININAAEADIVASCAKAGITISMIERLPSGGNRVVLNNTADTKAVAKTFSRQLLTDDVPRRPHFPGRASAGTGSRGAPQWPETKGAKR
jgi:hypothetical protein